jgi:hypothetical protein
MQRVSSRTAQTSDEIRKQSDGLKSAFNSLADLAGMRTFGFIWFPIKDTLLSVKSVFAGLATSIGFGAAAIAGAIAVAGAAVVAFGISLHAMASRGAADIKHIYDLANNLELSIGALTAYSLAPGIDSIESVGNLVYRLQGLLDEIPPAAQAALQSMQINPEQLKLASAEQQIRMLAAGYENLGDQVERVKAMRALFGRGSMPMMDLLEGGTAGLDRLQERVQRFGLDVSESQAKALRAAEQEWNGFGLAIQGIGRQAAIMLAPVWESIGRVGSAIGERIVSMFQTAQPYLEAFGANIAEKFAPLWGFISRIGETIGGMFVAIIPLAAEVGNLIVSWGSALIKVFTPLSFYSRLFEGTGQSFVEGFRVAVTWLKFGVEIAASFYDMIARTAVVVWEFAADALRAVATGIAEAFNMSFLADWFRSMGVGWNDIKTAALTVLAAIKVSLDRIRDVWDMAINAIKLKWLEFQRDLGVSGLDQQIRRLQNTLARGLGNFQDAIRAQVHQWDFELGGGLLRHAQQAAAVVQEAVRPLEVGLLKAQTDHGAVTRESERAFSLLNSTRGTQDFYQRAMAERLAQHGEFLRDIRAELRQAPVMRRARL